MSAATPDRAEQAKHSEFAVGHPSLCKRGPHATTTQRSGERRPEGAVTHAVPHDTLAHRLPEVRQHHPPLLLFLLLWATDAHATVGDPLNAFCATRPHQHSPWECSRTRLSGAAEPRRRRQVGSPTEHADATSVRRHREAQSTVIVARRLHVCHRCSAASPPHRFSHGGLPRRRQQGRAREGRGEREGVGGIRPLRYGS